MTTLTTRQHVRRLNLELVALAVKQARASLAAGDLGYAIALHARALRDVLFVRGRYDWTTATAGTERLLRGLLLDLVAAADALAGVPRK